MKIKKIKKTKFGKVEVILDLYDYWDERGGNIDPFYILKFKKGFKFPEKLIKKIEMKNWYNGNYYFRLWKNCLRLSKDAKFYSWISPHKEECKEIISFIKENILIDFFTDSLKKSILFKYKENSEAKIFDILYSQEKKLSNSLDKNIKQLEKFLK